MVVGRESLVSSLSHNRDDDGDGSLFGAHERSVSEECESSHRSVKFGHFVR